MTEKTTEGVSHTYVVRNSTVTITSHLTNQVVCPPITELTKLLANEMAVNTAEVTPDKVEIALRCNKP